MKVYGSVFSAKCVPHLKLAVLTIYIRLYFGYGLSVFFILFKPHDYFKNIVMLSENQLLEHKKYLRLLGSKIVSQA